MVRVGIEIFAATREEGKARRKIETGNGEGGKQAKRTKMLSCKFIVMPGMEIVEMS